MKDRRVEVALLRARLIYLILMIFLSLHMKAEPKHNALRLQLLYKLMRAEIQQA